MPGGQISKTRWKIRESSKNSDLYLLAVGMRKVEIFTCPGVGFQKLDGKLEEVRKTQIDICWLTKWEKMRFSHARGSDFEN